MDSSTTKSRAEIKAERREKQELQRAVKLSQKQPKNNQKNANFESNTKNKEITSKSNSSKVYDEIDLEIERLSFLWNSGYFLDSTCFIFALIDSVTTLFDDSSKSPMCDDIKMLDKYITNCSQQISLPTDAESFMHYLKTCIPISTSRDYFLEALETFKRKRVLNAIDSVATISQRVLKLLPTREVAIYSYSLSIQMALSAWEDSGEPLIVYIVECASVKTQASNLMSKLTSQGVTAYFVNLASLASVLSRVDVVLIGAETVYADGSVRAVAGSSVVCHMAETYRIPIYVLYETLKLSVHVCSVTMSSVGYEVVSRRFPMVFISENDIHSTIIGFSKRSVNIRN